MQCYMHATGILPITDTLQYTPNKFNLPKTTTEYDIQQAIVEIIEIIQYLPNTLPLLY